MQFCRNVSRTLNFVVRNESTKTEKSMCLENLALYGIFSYICTSSVLYNCSFLMVISWVSAIEGCPLSGVPLYLVLVSLSHLRSFMIKFTALSTVMPLYPSMVLVLLLAHHQVLCKARVSYEKQKTESGFVRPLLWSCLHGQKCDGRNLVLDRQSLCFDLRLCTSNLGHSYVSKP